MLEPSAPEKQFLEHVSTMVDYWTGKVGNVPPAMPMEERVEGLAFSLLVALDGGAMDLPGYVLFPNAEREDDRVIFQPCLHEWFSDMRKEVRNG